LRIARRTGIYRDRTIDKFPIPRAQYGFLAVALMRALENTEYPDRVAWIEDFKRIRNGVDAALFMTEAKLKVRYSMGMKKLARKGKETVESRGTVLEKLDIR
jgi:phospholipase C